MGDAREDLEAPRFPLRARLLLSFLAFVIPALMLECGARLVLEEPPPNAFPGISEGSIRDTELLWRNQPGYAQINEHGPINSLGFRGREVPLPKRPGLYRILSMGESTTFGDGVPWNRTYSYLLERELRRRGYDVQVMNAGVRAWSSVQSLRFLESEIDRLDPDLVLFYHEVNDFLPTVFRDTEFRSAGLTDLETMAITSKRSWLLRFVRSSRLLTRFSLAYARGRADAVLAGVAETASIDVMLILLLPYQRLPQSAPRAARPWMENPNGLVRVPDDEREATLRQLIRLTRDREVQLAFFHPAYRISVPHRCLLTRLADRQGIPVIEVEDQLIQDARLNGLEKGDYFLTDDPYHPNPRGHAVMAKGTAEVLEAANLLPPPPHGQPGY